MKAEFLKCIFYDFAGFEEVEFGVTEEEVSNIVLNSNEKESDIKKNYLTVFKYATFMDFSSFRGTRFSSGLDFSKTNLKDTPNFLNVYVDPKNTNRETFRIIKNSFSDTGNFIEESHFFVKEMEVYRKELNTIKKPFKINQIASKEFYFDNMAWFIININYCISGFGSNYIKPILMLIGLVFVYTFVTLWNEWYFESHDYFMSWQWFDVISKFLNEFAVNILPFRVFVKDKSGIEFISLFFYILFAILIWQIIVAVKRHAQR